MNDRKSNDGEVFDGAASDAPKRSYRSPRREAQARTTRRQIAEAARSLFLERGWAGTRVADVAAAAGVAEPTVYATYGSKAGLALALLDAVDEAADVDRVRAETEANAGHPQRQLAASVAFDRRLFEQAGDVVGLLRDARTTTPELADAYAQGVGRGDTARRGVFGRWPAATLREGLDVEAAVDIYAALVNIDSYRSLTVDRGWSPDRVEKWWNDALAVLLLR